MIPPLVVLCPPLRSLISRVPAPPSGPPTSAPSPRAKAAQPTSRRWPVWAVSAVNSLAQLATRLWQQVAAIFGKKRPTADLLAFGASGWPGCAPKTAPVVLSAVHINALAPLCPPRGEASAWVAPTPPAEEKTPARDRQPPLNPPDRLVSRAPSSLANSSLVWVDASDARQADDRLVGRGKKVLRSLETASSSAPAFNAEDLCAIYHLLMQQVEQQSGRMFEQGAFLLHGRRAGLLATALHQAHAAPKPTQRFLYARMSSHLPHLARLPLCGALPPFVDLGADFAPGSLSGNHTTLLMCLLEDFQPMADTGCERTRLGRAVLLKPERVGCRSLHDNVHHALDLYRSWRRRAHGAADASDHRRERVNKATVLEICSLLAAIDGQAPAVHDAMAYGWLLLAPLIAQARRILAHPEEGHAAAALLTYQLDALVQKYSRGLSESNGKRIGNEVSIDLDGLDLAEIPVLPV